MPLQRPELLSFLLNLVIAIAIIFAESWILKRKRKNQRRWGNGKVLSDLVAVTPRRALGPTMEGNDERRYNFRTARAAESPSRSLNAVGSRKRPRSIRPGGGMYVAAKTRRCGSEGPEGLTKPPATAASWTALQPPLVSSSRSIDEGKNRPPRTQSGSLTHGPTASNSNASSEKPRNQLIKERDLEYQESLRLHQQKDQGRQTEKKVGKFKGDDALERTGEGIQQGHQQSEPGPSEKKAKKTSEGDERCTIEPQHTDVGDNEEVATIAFKLPRSCCVGRITWQFRADAMAEQLVQFLRAAKEVKELSRWRLCQVVGGREITLDQSLRKLDLVPRGVVIVAEIEEDNDALATIDAGARTMSPRQLQRRRMGPRLATYVDRAKWDEERNSQNQFRFNIYGNGKDVSPTSCGTNSDADDQGSAAVHGITSTGFDSIQGIAAIPHLPGSDEALRVLERLHREFDPVVRTRGWTVNSLTEMCCCGDGNEHLWSGPRIERGKGSYKAPHIGGYCESLGDRRTAIGIHVRLRPPGTCHKLSLIPYNDVVAVMAHELAHIVISPHNDLFYELMAEIEKERLDALARGGVMGEDRFPVRLGPGRRLGGGRERHERAVFLRDLRRQVANASLERQRQQQEAKRRKLCDNN